MEKQILLFINWNPESCPLKNRMIYSQAREQFKSKLDLHKHFTLFAKDDVIII